jgi:hypothetical protein
MEFLELIKLRAAASSARDMATANFACMGED